MTDPNSLATWQHTIISRILQVRFVESDLPASNLAFLPLAQFTAELISEGMPLQFSQDILERAIMARLSILNDESTLSQIDNVRQKELNHLTHFEYFVQCWHRLDKAASAALASKLLQKEKLAILKQIRGMVVNYAGITLQFPDMFPQAPHLAFVFFFVVLICG